MAQQAKETPSNPQIVLIKKVKRDVFNVDAMKTYGKGDVFVHPFLASAVYDEWPASGSSRSTTGEGALNPSAWSDGHCPHAARSHSFVYISTS